MSTAIVTIEASEIEALPGLDHQLRGYGHEVTVVPRLTVGDVAWIAQRGEENILCLAERKRPNDLTSSVNDGRLQRFLEDAPPGAFRCLLLHLPDSLRRMQAGLTYGGWTWARLDALLMSLQAEGVFIAYAIDDLCPVAERLHGLIEWTHKGEHNSLHRPIVPAPPGRYTDPMYRKQVAALMCTPGIGEELAQRLLSGSDDGIGPRRRRDASRFWDESLLGAIQLLTQERNTHETSGL